jgi:DNA adenine methylase
MLNPLVNYRGGKRRIIPWILESLPEGSTYIEPFGGSCAVLGNKKRVAREIYNDLNPRMINLLQVIQKGPQRLEELMIWSVNAKEQFISFEASMDGVGPEAAFAYMYRSRYSFSSLCEYWGRRKAVSDLSDRIPLLWAWHERLQGVTVTSQDALTLWLDYPDTVIYCDPPYLCTRDPYQTMAGGFGQKEHKRLLDRLFAQPNFFAVSGYPSDLYDGYPWTKVKDCKVATTLSKDHKDSKTVERLYVRQP